MRRADRVCRAALLGLVLLGACSRRPADLPVASAAATAPVCKVGADGGPVLADRGIGGTGTPPTTGRLADRGIGGTGIVGVVTGFASVCLAGHEVGFDPAVPIQVDGVPGSAAALRVGHVAAVEAFETGPGLHARRIVVRYEVVGPVEAIEADGTLRVAGQSVVVTPETWVQAPPRRGNWLSVSGLRGPNGVIEATRLDPHSSGTVLVRGTLVQEGPLLRIGTLEIRPATRLLGLAGRAVTVAGRYADGVVYADTLLPDLLMEDPSAYFGRGVTALVLEGYVSVGDGRARWRGLDVAARPGLGRVASQRGIMEFQRRPDGSLQATGLAEPGPRDRLGTVAPMPSRSFEPAPVPHGSMQGGGLRGSAAPDRPGRGGDPSRLDGRRDDGGAGPGRFGAPLGPGGPSSFGGRGNR